MGQADSIYLFTGTNRYILLQVEVSMLHPQLHPPFDVFLFPFRQSQRTPQNLGDYSRNSKSFLRNVA